VTQRFVISIRPQSSEGVSAAFTVDVQAGLIQVREIRVQNAADGSHLPAELADFDYGAFVFMAADLSRGQFPLPERADSHQKISNDPDDGPQEPRVRRSPPTSAVVDAGGSAVRRHAASRSQTGIPPDLARVYWNLGGSTVKVAKHYDVPHHIAKDWVRELRNQNVIATRWKAGSQWKKTTT
jgi:hypothetical protein